MFFSEIVQTTQCGKDCNDDQIIQIIKNSYLNTKDLQIIY